MEFIEESIEYFEKICKECDEKYGKDERACAKCPVKCAISCMGIVQDAKETCQKRYAKVTS